MIVCYLGIIVVSFIYLGICTIVQNYNFMTIQIYTICTILIWGVSSTILTTSVDRGRLFF